MKIDFSKTLVDLDGEPLKESISQDSPEKKEITLKDLCANALINSVDGEAPEKLRKYELALKISNAKTKTEMLSEDIVLIKKCIEKYPPLFYGQAVHLLEGKGE